MEGYDPIEQKEVELVMPFTKDGYCPFLNKDYTCNIYDDRPAVCQRYGSEERSCLRCPYQDKDGRTRSRQESRSILRQAAKEAEKLINIGKSSKNSQASQ
jgi:Fe-S-cluster containining protein